VSQLTGILFLMGDPLSVAGTAVGIASLGIQVCQGLLQYYASWKSYNEDITTTFELIESFEKTLVLLCKAINRLDPSPELLQQVAGCINDCKSGIERLKKKFKKIEETTPGASRLKLVLF